MSRGMKAGLAGLVLVGITWISREAWCAALGRFFTDGNLESGSAADFAVVPAADYIRPDVSIQALEEVVRLQRTGSVKGILMSCPDYYGISECELAETALRNRGYPGVRFDWLRTKPLPDDIEAGQTVRWLAERGAKSAIVILPNYKVRRLGSIYRRPGTRSAIRVEVSGQDREFNPQSWWRSREGQKRFAEELVRITHLL